MRQVVIGIHNNILASSGNEWGFPGGGSEESSTVSDANFQFPMPVAGVIENFRGKIAAAIVNGNAEAEIYSTADSTGPQVDITPGNTEGSSSDTLAVSAGDRLSIRLEDNGDTYKMAWSFTFVSTLSNHGFVLGGSDASMDEGDDGYLFPIGIVEEAATEADAAYVCPTTITLKSFYVHLAAASGGTTRTFTIYVNGVAQASTAVAFATADTDKNVTGLSILVSPGDTISIRQETVGNTTPVIVTWGIGYESFVDGESIIGGWCDVALSNTLNQVQYGYLNGSMPSPDSFFLTEPLVNASADSVQGLVGEAVTLKKFRVNISSAPGSNQSRKFRIRKNGANGNKSITISGSNTSGIDDTNLETFAAGDLVNISHEAITSAPNATTYTKWSAVIFRDPTGGGDEGESGGSGGISGHTLPSYNASICSALKHVQQNQAFPQFIMGGAGGSGGTTYSLFKKGSIYKNHILRKKWMIGRRFRVTRIALRLGAAITEDMAMTPRLYFDGESRSQNGTEIILNNYPNGERFIVLTEDNFLGNTEGKNDFILELQSTGSALLPILPFIQVEVEIYDNPHD